VSACITRVRPNGQYTGRAKNRILLRDRYRCVYCGEAFRPDELTVDHVQPRMRGGDGSEGNLVTCCRGCNALKGGMAAWAFLVKYPEMRATFFAAVEQCDATQAKPVWDRLLRAIREAVAKGNPEAPPVV
jgi:HNH endonuclease